MARITKTVLFPVPTDWMGQDADPDEVGIVTYTGPRYLKTLWDPERPGDCVFVGDPETDKACETPNPVGTVEVTLDAEQYPLHAISLWGWEDPAEQLEVQCGPDDEPNPTICDPYHFTEVFDLRSFYYDTATSSWSAPQFSSDELHSDEDAAAAGDTVCTGWNWVRKTRNQMLVECDSRVAAPDMPDSVRQPWLDYRQKLRDIPENWANVGNQTHLIVWPLDPDQIARGIQYGERPNNGITD